MSEQKINSSRERYLHWAFEIGVYLKGFDGFLQIIGGFFFLLIKPETLNNIIITFTEHEIIEDPRDHIANYLIRTIHNLSFDTKLFGALFLLTHGVVKILFAAGLLQNKLWAYPGAIGVFSLFILYQFYRLSYHYSAGLALITLIDIVVVILTWHEYRHISGFAKKT